MSKANINFVGGINDAQQGKNLTGSQTIFSLDIGKTKNIKIVIDAGAIQGVKKAGELNKDIKKGVLSANFLVITHAHSDHAGIVPYLYKKGFSGRIIMTELTKLQCREMWFDYVRLTRNEIDEITKINSKIAKKLKNSLSIKNLYENVIQPESYLQYLKKENEKIESRNKEIKNYYTHYLKIKTAYETLQEIYLKEKGKLTQYEKEKLKQDKERIIKSLERIIKNNDLKSAYNESIEILNKKNINNSEDISKLLKTVPKIEKSSKNKDAALSKISQITGSVNYEAAYIESITILKEYGVESEQDISSVLKEIPVLLFDENDIDLVYNKIETLEINKELDLQNFHPISSGTDKIIDELPKMIKAGFNKQIPVLSYLKGTVTSKLLGFIKKIEKESRENEKIKAENEELSNKLKLALNFVKLFEENGESISNFENEYGNLINVNKDELIANIAKLSNITLKGKEYNINDLIKIYHSFKFKLPTGINDYIELENELKELGILTEEDINKHLPNLPDRDYKNIDIKAALNKAILVEDNSNINISNYVVYINDLNQYSPSEILNFFKLDKKVFINNNISAKIFDKTVLFIQSNNENIKRNDDIKKALFEAYDLIQIYEGNKELYLKNNKNEYVKAKKFVENYKKETITETKYDKEDIDYIVDFDYTSVAENEIIIHIKRLDDSRLYDVLYNNNLNIVYYFEPKIRDRIKEKLIDQISKIKTLKEISDERNKIYVSYLHFIKIYEGKENLYISKKEYEDAKELLKKHNIESKDDINKLNFFNTDYPYTLKDIENYFSLANLVSQKNFSIENIEIIYITSLDDERIYDLPYIYNDKNKLVVIKKGLKDRIKEKLQTGIGDFYKISNIRKRKRNELLEKFRLFIDYSKNYEYLFNLDGQKNASDFLNELLVNISEIRSISEKLSKIKYALELKAKITEGYSQKESDYIEAKKLLREYNIENLDDISKVLKIEHYLEYGIDDVKKAISLLKGVHIDKNGSILESIKLNFFDAGHIEGSIQAVITTVVSEVDNTLILKKIKKDINTNGKRRLKHINYGFSGDLGRIKDPNLAGTPKKIPFKLDYYQIESTYADRIHLDKKNSINKLFSSIDGAKGKILIPAFSIQRTQEILMIILERRLKSQENINKIKELINKKRLKEDEFSQYLPNTTDRNILKTKEAIEQEINNLELNINYLKTRVFDIDIILDSPLSEKITEIYVEKCGNKYNLLNKDIQKKLFGKEIIYYVKKTGKNISTEENDGKLTLGEIYSLERRDKKEIIISASGMCDGGAILPHLKENISNPNSKIIAVGYAPENTRLGKIKSLDDFININGEAYELKCEVDDIPGFSGHIDEEEIIMLLTEMEFKKGAILALTHGDEKRFILSDRIQKAMKKVGKKIEIIVPKLSDTIDIKI